VNRYHSPALLLEHPLSVLCLSHLRWDFVYQRPQHLLSRCARSRCVWFFEEPVRIPGGAPRLEIHQRDVRLRVVVPQLPDGLRAEEENNLLTWLVNELLRDEPIGPFVLWYYTPMALDFTRHLSPDLIVYDCMDELAAFRGAPPAMNQREAELLERADLVFTGGRSLFRSRRNRHSRVFLFPSAVDADHFRVARSWGSEPPEQGRIPRPRLGYAGVIDERMDLDLVTNVAEARPEWQIVMLGPIAKLDPSELPRRANIHYLGPRPYGELPRYMAGWDAALVPFAKNRSTRYISPTKIPEYLASGRQVVATGLPDIRATYHAQASVHIAGDAAAFVGAIERAMASPLSDALRLAEVDEWLSGCSWEQTWSEMWQLVTASLAECSWVPPTSPL
jgi:UDP-galactopyranose mutase